MCMEVVEQGGVRYAEILWATASSRRRSFSPRPARPSNLVCWLTMQVTKSQLTITSR